MWTHIRMVRFGLHEKLYCITKQLLDMFHLGPQCLQYLDFVLENILNGLGKLFPMIYNIKKVMLIFHWNH